MSNSYDVTFNSPLELRLKEIAARENSHNSFPHCGMDRFDLYSNIKAKMNERYYRDIDSGLTADSKGGAYTHHDLGHVDDVIRRAGHLLGAGSEAQKPALYRLNDYEVFVLLVACLIHDSGNITGRTGHESRARQALRAVQNDVLDQKEISLISGIAQAHGGTTQEGRKDTIGQLRLEDGVEHSKVRPQLLAAILRYADELAENSRRASNRASGLSVFPNLFCQSISIRVDYDSRRVYLNFTVANDLCITFGKDETGEELYFVDYIRKRVKKCELERRYCDRFLRGFATFDETRVHIEFLRHDQVWKEIHFELKESGYPIPMSDIISIETLSGKLIADQYTARASAEEQANA